MKVITNLNSYKSAIESILAGLIINLQKSQDHLQAESPMEDLKKTIRALETTLKEIKENEFPQGDLY